MKKFITVLLVLFISTSIESQINQMVSDSAYFVLEVDLGKVVKSVPIEEINKLELAQSLLKEFSAEIKSIKNLSDLGVDFSSKLIVFTLERAAYSSVTMIVPLKERDKFIQLFKPEQQNNLLKNGSIERDGIIISLTGFTCVMSSVNWNSYYFEEKTENIYEKYGWINPRDFYRNIDYGYTEEDLYNMESEYEDAEEEEAIEDADTIEDYYNEEIYSQFELEEKAAEEKYNSVLDSITTVEKAKTIKQHLNFIKQPNNNLSASDELYKKVSNYPADAKIYMNPMMNYSLSNNFIYEPLGEILNEEFKEMKQFAYLNFTHEGIQVDWKVQFSDNMGAIMKEAQSSKLDKNLFKYIPYNAQGIALYNLNGFGIYNKIKNIYMPKLDASDKESELFISAVWSTIDEFIDIEAITSVYAPKVLASYSGFKEVELTKISYEYDEETFEYSEVEIPYIEKLPILTFALSNERAFLIEKYLKAFSKSEEVGVKKKNNYYTFNDKSISMGVPFHIAIVDNVLLITNDENTVINHLNGFSIKAFDRNVYKKAKKAKLLYAYIDFNLISQNIADLDFFSKTNEIKRLFNDKTGKMELELITTSKNQAHYKIYMETIEKYKNGGYFLFELMNTIYLYNR